MRPPVLAYIRRIRIRGAAHGPKLVTRRIVRHVCIASSLILLWCAGLATAAADDGAAHNGPHSVSDMTRAVDFNDGGSLVAYLDQVAISPVATSVALTPHIVSLVAPSAEVVVADAVVTETPFLADPTGARDSTHAFAEALAAVSAHGGGTVFAPAGVYRIDGALVIPRGSTLRGADLRDRSDPNRIGTLLLASFGEGDQSAASFISLGLESCVRDLAIWYPSQGFTSDTVRPYPFTVSFDDCCASAQNLLLYDSYDGIAVRSGSNHLVADIVGTVLHHGLAAGNSLEYSWLSNVAFGNDIWKSAPQTLITNAPSSAEDRLALDAYTSSHVTGVQIGQNDGYDAYGIRIRDAHRDVVIQKLPQDEWPFYGVVSRIDGGIEEVDGYRGSDLHFLDTDQVPGTEGWSYEFTDFRSAANGTNFANVKDQPFSAVGDGSTDDTAAIQAALDKIGSVGGGTVYLPQGRYRVTRLTIPTGVELRGPLGGGVHHSGITTCALLGNSGKGSQAPASDPALLTLSPHSGIRGFDVVYPDQGYGSPAAPVSPYPFTIRGTGAGTWVENVSVANAFNLIDLATFRCDDHFVSGVEATVLNTGILVGGGSKDGRLERVLITYGIYGGFVSLSESATTFLATYTRQNAAPFVLGDCAKETTFGLDSFDVRIGWLMLADGGGCIDSTFWQSSSDSSSQAGYRFEGGDNLRFIGVAAGSSAGTSFLSSASFSGSVDVYGTMSWGNLRNRELSGGVFRFHNERSLTLGKAATASSTAPGEEGPSSAVDGSEFTKWVSASGGSNWLTVDLDQPSEIDRWVVRHAGIDGGPDDLNTNAFALQVSDDGVTFGNADSVIDNGNRLTDRPVAARGRFVRLLVAQGTSGGDGRARIYEFEAHGKEGWQFTNDAEGWTPISQIAAFTVGDGKLEISSSNGQPTVASPDNLNIPTSKFAALRVRMRNSGAPTSAKVSFTTQADPAFSESKGVTIGTVLSSPEYMDYYFGLGANVGWTGTLRQLRLTPIQGAGDISIDSIALEETDPHSRNLVPPQSPTREPRIVPR